MFRNEFLRLVMNSGMMTLNEMRELEGDKNPNSVSEALLLTHKDFVDEKFAKLMADNYTLELVDLSNVPIPPDTLTSITKSTVVKYRVVCIQKNAQGLVLATYDPTIIPLLEELKGTVKKPLKLVLTSLSNWYALFEKVARTVEEVVQEMELINVDASEEDSAKVEDIGQEIINVVNRILADAYIKKASDIHVEPYEGMFRVRFRMDGSLIEVLKQSKSIYRPIVQRLKIMAKMDITEKRKPLDGRIKMKIGPMQIDYRVSSLPTLFGEKMVLRLLDSSSLQLDMTKLGFENQQLAVFKEAIMRPFGMCLVTGPTGSGKTTTLYSAIQALNTVDSNVSTVEDPVEFNMVGINQVNVKKDVGLTFASALKSFLRQDPDVIMVGEIRDYETGEIAVEAALTGHLVLSTLHTNDAPSTVTRLLNMGIESFLIVGALNVVVAQRLCRKICLSCRIEAPEITPAMLMKIGLAKSSAEKMKVYRGKGCSDCNNTGYKGRVAIYEVLPMTQKVREVILEGGSAEAIKQTGIKEGMKTLRMSALQKVAKGLTTIEEAVSNSSGDNPATPLKGESANG